jgi:hypothetical protein
MHVLNKKGLKLKAMLLSHDGGRSWIVGRQYYLTDLETNLLLNESMQGLFLTQKQENTNDNEHQLPRS